jgi:O-antigen/teichoic acid export membrane protein
MAFSQFLRVLIGMMIVSGFLKHYRIQWSLSVAKELIRQSWIMGLATFCTGLSLRIDVYFLKYFRTSEEIALFHIPHMFTLQIQILAISVVTALFPVFSRWSVSRQDAERFKTAQEMSIRLMSMTGLAIAFTAALFPKLIIHILGGRLYYEAVPAMVILSWCIPILFLNYLMANLLTAIKKQHLLIYGAVTSLLLNAALDYVWVPLYGIVGASFATVISYGVQLAMVCYLLQINSKHRVGVVSSIALPAVFCLAGFSLVFYLDGALEVSSLVSGIVRLVTIAAVTAGMYVIQPPSFSRTLKSLRRKDFKRGKPERR